MPKFAACFVVVVAVFVVVSTLMFSFHFFSLSHIRQPMFASQEPLVYCPRVGLPLPSTCNWLEVRRGPSERKSLDV